MNLKTLLSWIVLLLFHQSCKVSDTDLSKPQILLFEFKQVKALSSNIDLEKQIIEVTLPYGTVLKELTPTMNISEGASIVPASGISQDFTKVLYYTLTSKTGVKTIYTVKVKTEEQPSPQILSFSQASIEAGEQVVVKGNYFGNFGLAIKAYLVDSLSKEYAVKHTFKDSSEVVLQIPSEQSPAQYQVKLVVNQKSVLSSNKLRVSYASPQLKELVNYHVLQGDTLWVLGSYIDTQKYTIALRLKQENQEYVLNAKQDTQGRLYALSTLQLPVGAYQVRIENQSENKQSAWSTAKINLYDASKPFVLGIVNEQNSYKAGENISFKTLNFDKMSTRFYQIALKSDKQQYFLNGQYEANPQTLNANLPSNAEKGVYTLSFYFTQSNTGIQYSFQIDKKINITQ